MSLWWLLPTLALASPQDHLGRPVASVVVDAPQGGLPEESLEPLLSVAQGTPLAAADVRRDLATLVRVGEFAAVEAIAEPWVLYDVDGEPVPAVELTYRVFPSARVDRVRLQGVTELRKRDVLDTAAISSGEVFHPEIDGPMVAQAVERLYRRRGFPEAMVEVDAVELAANEVEVWVRVFEGAPVMVDQVRFVGELPLPLARLRTMAAQEGVKQGRPLSAEALSAVRIRIQNELRALRTGPFGIERRGWVQARVTPALTNDGDDTVVSFTIEPGPRLRLEVHGVGGLTPRSTVEEALELSSRPRLTAGFVAEAPERLEAHFAALGFRDTRATVSLERTEEEQVLFVDVQRGQRTRVARWDFIGAQALSNRELSLVLAQASDVLALRRVTDEALAQGLAAAARVYNARGYQQARLELREITGDTKLTVTIDVDEGPLTRVGTLALAGMAQPEWEGPFLVELEQMRQQPYSPQALAEIAGRIERFHRDRGYLQASAEVRTQHNDSSGVDASISVEPGPQVLLRSVLIRGARGTDPRLVRRQVVGELGKPITPELLEQTRRNLYSLGIFRSVDTRLVGDEEATRDLLVTLVERDAWGFEVGLGLSTDQGIQLTGRAVRRNLLRRAHRLELYGLLGLDYAGDTLEDWSLDITGPEYRGALTWTAPQFPSPSDKVIIDVLFREEEQERTWRMGRSGVGVALTRDFGVGGQLRLAYRIEARQLEELDPGALLEGEPWDGLLAADSELPTAFRAQDSLTGLFLLDLRDDPVLPRRGALFRLLGEASTGLFSGITPSVDVSRFVKVQARGVFVLPLGSLALRTTLDAGYAYNLEGILPAEDRFRLGGTGSLRGFARDGVGPKNEVEQLDIDWPSSLAPAIDNGAPATRWVPTGGDTFAAAIIELDVPFPALGLAGWDRFSWVSFVDLGNVWLLDPSTVATSTTTPTTDLYNPWVRVGAGMGLRVSTPVGPLQLDLATNPEAIAATGALRDLLVGAWEEPYVRVHLALGTLW